MVRLPSYQLRGTVTKVRELRSKANNDVFAFIVNVAAPGQSFELETREQKIADQFKQGGEFDFSGGFAEYMGRLKLLLGQYAPVAVVQPTAK